MTFAFVVVAAAAVTGSPWLLVAGLAGHGFKDLWQHRSTAGAALTSARAGLRPGTPDALPIVGWSTALPNLMYATGHFRNGVLLCPLTAHLVARAMIDNEIDPALEAIGPQRFGAL